MQPRRIILANGSRFLRDMLKRVIEKVPDLRVVGEVTDLARLSSAILQTDAQWVIVSRPPNGKLPEVVESLLLKHPLVRILSVATDGSQVRMKWLESHEQVLDGSSLDELIAILRRRSPWNWPGRSDHLLRR